MNNQAPRSTSMSYGQDGPRRPGYQHTRRMDPPAPAQPRPKPNGWYADPRRPRQDDWEQQGEWQRQPGDWQQPPPPGGGQVARPPLPKRRKRRFGRVLL